MTTIATPGPVGVVDDCRDQRCPRCTRVLRLDHKTKLGGVLHAECSSCKMRYLSAAGSWVEFGGCQGCRVNYN